MALGSKRGTAHAAQDNAGEALGPGLRPQLVDLGDRGVETRGLHSAETDGGFESGIGTTQGVVLRENPGVTPVYDKCRDVLFNSRLRSTGSVVAESDQRVKMPSRAVARAPSTSARSSFQLATNLSSPSDSRRATTSL